MCVDTCRFATLYYKTHCNGCVHFAWGWFCGGSRSTKPCVFRVKWLQPEINGSACAAGAAGVVLTFFLCLSVTVASSCFECVCVCARSFRVAWNLLLHIAVEWLHDWCRLLLPCA